MSSSEAWPPKEEFIGLPCSFWSETHGCGYPKAEIQGETKCAGQVAQFCVDIIHGKSRPVTGAEALVQPEDRDEFLIAYFEKEFDLPTRWLNIETMSGSWMIIADRDENGRILIACRSDITENTDSYCVHLDTDEPDEHIHVDRGVGFHGLWDEITTQTETGLYLANEDEMKPFDELVETLRIYAELGQVAQ